MGKNICVTGSHVERSRVTNKQFDKKQWIHRGVGISFNASKYIHTHSIRPPPDVILSVAQRSRNDIGRLVRKTMLVYVK